jgi:hypothetical protein
VKRPPGNCSCKPDLVANTTDICPPPCQYVLSVNNNLLYPGMEDGSIPSMVADSACTSGVGTADDTCWRTGQVSNKQFVLPGNKIKSATEIAEYPFKDRGPANKLHITPGITENLLLSAGQFAAANYITMFDKEEVNIYNANNTINAVTRGAILQEWWDAVTRLWRIPLVVVVRNNNTDTVIVNSPPTEFLPKCPPPTNAIHNIYELKTQPELMRYYHAAAGFPTKPTWVKAIRNKQFASWPGLTVEAVKRHYPDSEETPKGHGRKTPSSLQSTKQTTLNNSDNTGDSHTSALPRPTKKERTIFICILDMEDKATQKIFTDQPWRFPKKSSHGNQYIMVLTKSNSDAILIELMKNRTAGEMIRAYQTLIDQLRTAGIVPKLHILDNECSQDFKDTIHLNKMMFQLAPPHNH